jgi:DNA-binding transcriptional LysR family regulator
MDVRTLRYFAFVAEAGSIHGGARMAMVAQPAVSVAVKKLERTVGKRLFVRSPQGVELTPAGRTLLVHARELLRHVDQLEHEAEQILSEPPTFTIGLVSGPASAGELTLPIIDAFRAARPDLDLRLRELNFGDQFDAVIDGVVDAALVRSPFVHDELAFRPLFSEPTVVVASPDNHLADREQVTIEEVLAERPLEVTRAPRVWRDFWGLSDYRGGMGGAIPSGATTLMDYSIDVLRNATVSPMAQSGWRFGGLAEPGLRAMTIVDAPRSVIGVGHRADEERADVLAFAEVARDVSARLVSWVPNGEIESAPA